MGNADSARLVEGPVGRTLARLTVPMLFGIFGLVGFNLVDTFFVGQLGSDELAALTFTFPVVFTISGLALGLGVGATALISRAIGARDHRRVQQLTTHSLLLALSVVVAFVAVGLTTIEPLFRLLGASDEVLPLVARYMRIWYWGAPFVVVPMVGNSAIRATGDTTTPAAIMIAAMAMNVVLDPLLIFGLGPFPRLELEGAATATVIARAGTCALALGVLHFREHMIVAQLRGLWRSWAEVLYVGVPAAATRVILPTGIGVITRLVASYGDEAVGAFGVAARIDTFTLAVFMALSSVLGPFVGQNWGAGHLGRVREGVAKSQRFAMAWGALSLVVLAVVARPLARLFADDPVVVDTIVLYLHIVPVGYGLHGVLMLSNASLNVLNRPLYAALLTLVEMFALYIPLAHIGSNLWALEGLFSAAAIAPVMAGALAWLWLRRVMARMMSAAVSAGS